jgi:TolA-binding protein
MNPMSLLMLLGVPASEEVQRMANGDPIHGTLSARRLGDSGAHFEAVVDAPIVSVNQVRDVIAQLQAQQAQQMEQMQQAQQQRMQQMQQMQAAARRAQQQRGVGMMMPPVPSSPDQLPEPNFQLRPPSH